MEQSPRPEREFTPAGLAERSIVKKYRRAIWNPFIAGIKRYGLIAEGDRIAVSVTGTAESLLLGAAMKMLVRFSDFPFEAVFFAPEDREKTAEAAAYLELPVRFYRAGEDAVRSFLEAAAAEGCGKAALPDTADDACAAVLSSMLFEGVLRGLMPKEKDEGGNLTLIRPLFCVEGGAVSAWARYNGVPACPCCAPADPHRTEAADLLRRLKEVHPDVEKCVFNSLHAMHRDTFPGYILNGERHSFLEGYGK